MNKLFACVASLAILSGAALAADLPSRKEAPVYFPPPPTALWNGLYVGLNAGGAWDATAATRVASGPFLINGPANAPWAFSSAAAGPTSLSTRNDGFIGGGQIGANFQYGNVLLGIETDLQGLAAGNGASAATIAPTPLAAAGLFFVTTTASSKSLDYLGTVRARMGYLVTPTLLAYATGGLAYGGITSTTNYSQIIPNDTPGFLFAGLGRGQSSSARAGWTVGGGVEWMFLPNWSAKVEYLFYDLGDVTYPVGVSTDLFLSSVLAANAIQARASYEGHIVRAGVNYHFNWIAPGPVLAKY